MAVCPFFKIGAICHRGLSKVRNLNCRSLQSANVRHRVKFRASQAGSCQDVAVFRFFKMAAVRHLGFAVRLSGPPTKSI